jgi:hypothetical protein
MPEQFPAKGLFMLPRIRSTCVGLACLAMSAGAATAQDAPTLPDRPTLNFYGMPGLIDMPTASALPDATLGTTVSHFAGTTRSTLTFQVLPRVTASFRYTILDGVAPGGRSLADTGLYLDRSFDVQWLAIEEGGWWPSVAIGARDFIGTGVYSSEYVTATRHFGARDQLAVTVGLGWGRLASRDGFTNPLGIIDSRFETRPGNSVGQGGTVDLDRYFRGDAALFGGIEWQVTDRLRLQLEYSSDTYEDEVAGGLFGSSDNPINLGLSYRLGQAATLGASFMHGDTFGISLAFQINPRRPANTTLSTEAPLPIVARPTQAAPYGTDWIAQPDGPALLRDNVQLLMRDEGIALVGLNLDATRAVIRVRNDRYQSESMALGRVLRILTATMPNSVEIFEVVFVVQGIDVSRVRMARSEVEALEHHPDGAELGLAVARFEDPVIREDPDAIVIPGQTSRFTWSISPYIETAIFDPDAPIRADIGVQARARYEFGGGFVADGWVRARVAGNLDQSRQVDPSVLPPVRTDAFRYRQEGDIRIERLTFAHYGRPGRNLYSRVSLGYLERMHAGVSAELLWAPVNRNYGFGIEVNHTWQRDYDGGLGLQDYDITTGHVSAYLDVGDDFEVQVDAGRYLAGDWGATLSVERTFNNGWRVGAFATLTDVEFDDFGEGSFDKGITLEIPLGWAIGTATRDATTATLRPLLRDGGARLELDGRLHDIVTDYHQPRLEETQGVLWR